MRRRAPDCGFDGCQHGSHCANAHLEVSLGCCRFEAQTALRVDLIYAIDSRREARDRGARASRGAGTGVRSYADHAQGSKLRVDEQVILIRYKALLVRRALDALRGLERDCGVIDGLSCLRLLTGWAAAQCHAQRQQEDYAK